MPEQKWQFEQDGLLINASRMNGKGSVSWCGISDSRTPALFLRPILRELSEKLKGAEVTVDLSGPVVRVTGVLISGAPSR